MHRISERGPVDAQPPSSTCPISRFFSLSDNGFVMLLRGVFLMVCNVTLVCSESFYVAHKWTKHIPPHLGRFVSRQ